MERTGVLFFYRETKVTATDVHLVVVVSWKNGLTSFESPACGHSMAGGYFLLVALPAVLTGLARLPLFCRELRIRCQSILRAAPCLSFVCVAKIDTLAESKLPLRHPRVAMTCCGCAPLTMWAPTT